MAILRETTKLLLMMNATLAAVFGVAPYLIQLRQFAGENRPSPCAPPPALYVNVAVLQHIFGLAIAASCGLAAMLFVEDSKTLEGLGGVKTLRAVLLLAIAFSAVAAGLGIAANNNTFQITYSCIPSGVRSLMFAMHVMMVVPCVFTYRTLVRAAASGV